MFSDNLEGIYLSEMDIGTFLLEYNLQFQKGRLLGFQVTGKWKWCRVKHWRADRQQAELFFIFRLYCIFHVGSEITSSELGLMRN